MAHYRGSPLGIRILLSLHRYVAYRHLRKIVWFIALFYAVLSRKKRFELYGYYGAVGLKPSFWTYLRHVHAFALTIFDRFVSRAGSSEVSVERTNVESFEHLIGHGGIVVLSHLGNWAQSFKIFQTYDVTLNIVMAEQMDEQLSTIEALSRANERIRIIQMHTGMQAVVDIANALSRNEIVLMMADRVYNPAKTVAVDFFGRKAYFNSGPFELARMRNTPMTGLSILRQDDNHIAVRFTDLITLDPGIPKSEAVDSLAAQYAKELEKVVQAYPLQWFNFYDFWGVPADAAKEGD